MFIFTALKTGRTSFQDRCKTVSGKNDDRNWCIRIDENTAGVILGIISTEQELQKVEAKTKLYQYNEEI